VTGLLYSSRKYSVDALMDRCLKFLEESLTEDNVCQILEQCHGYGEVDLEQKALKILTEAGVKVIKSPGFLDLCSRCIHEFLKSEQLKLKEEQIFEAVMSWARGQCKAENVIENRENLRRILGEMINEIRFTEFSLDYLVSVVGPSEILTNDERVRVMDKLVKKDVDISPFNALPRKQTKEVKFSYVTPYSKLYTANTGLTCSNMLDFSTDKNIELVGCQLHGSVKHTESIYNLRIQVRDDQNQAIATPVPDSQRSLKGRGQINDIIFPDVVPIRSGREYWVCATMTGEKVNFSKRWKNYVTVDGVQFTFHPNVYGETSGVISGLIWKHTYNSAGHSILGKRKLKT